jgi:hypothetical protein
MKNAVSWDFLFVIPFYYQSVQVHSANCVSIQGPASSCYGRFEVLTVVTMKNAV